MNDERGTMSFTAKAKRIKLILFDVDGVPTDGDSRHPCRRHGKQDVQYSRRYCYGMGGAREA